MSFLERIKRSNEELKIIPPFPLVYNYCFLCSTRVTKPSLVLRQEQRLLEKVHVLNDVKQLLPIVTLVNEGRLLKEKIPELALEKASFPIAITLSKRKLLIQRLLTDKQVLLSIVRVIR